MAAFSETLIEVTFGDCDPAGIVFYPNFFAWMDRSFHNFLRPLGGHAMICRELEALGIGLVRAEAEFLRPVRDGDTLLLTCRPREWGPKLVTFEHVGSLAGSVVVKGTEVRAVFRQSDNGMFAGKAAPLQQMVEDFARRQ
jgi:4-hydroxybenzoyl-CoA thioesterase